MAMMYNWYPYDSDYYCNYFNKILSKNNCKGYTLFSEGLFKMVLLQANINLLQLISISNLAKHTRTSEFEELR
jgi:hypothetical protein